MTRHALERVKVVDFSWLLTGPIATKYLANFGAEVIKIESTRRPDQLRGTSPYRDEVPGINRSGTFAYANDSKYSATLNLDDPRGVEIAKRLVARADVVLETFRPGIMKKWGLDYEELKRVKPDIIMVSMSMQGQTGPFSLQPLLGAYLQAGAGITYLTGWPDQEPVGVPNPYLDFISPWFLLVAILSALDYRQRTGKGQYIDLSQIETSLHFLAPALLDYTANRRVQNRNGNRCDYACPHGAYRCKGDDRWCAIAVFNDEEWRSFCRVCNSKNWTVDSRFATLMGRKNNEDELEKLIEEWTINYSPAELMTMLQEAGAPAGVIQGGEDLLEWDPQLRHRGHFVTLNHPEIGPHVGEEPPFKLSRTPAKMSLPAPCLGEHTEYVCTKILGMPDSEFLKLLAAGVFE